MPEARPEGRLGPRWAGAQLGVFVGVWRLLHEAVSSERFQLAVAARLATIHEEKAGDVEPWQGRGKGSRARQHRFWSDDGAIFDMGI